MWKLPRGCFCIFSVLYFFQHSSISSFHFTLLYFNAFHVLPLSFHMRYFHVLPLSVHILSLSLHAMSKSSQIENSECMTLVTMVVTIYMCEYWGGGKQQQIYTHTKAFPFVFVPFPFHFCSHSFHVFLFSCQFLSLPSMFLPFPSIISLFYVLLI